MMVVVSDCEPSSATYFGHPTVIVGVLLEVILMVFNTGRQSQNIECLGKGNTHIPVEE